MNIYDNEDILERIKYAFDNYLNAYSIKEYPIFDSIREAIVKSCKTYVLQYMHNNSNLNSIYYLKNNICYAKGIMQDNNSFIVKAGSTLLPLKINYNDEHRTKYIKKRKTLEQKGFIDGLLVIKDFETNSPSEAANIILGYRVSGREKWKDENGISINDKKRIY